MTPYMITLLVSIASVLWVLAALLCLKIEGMFCEQPTCWLNLPLALGVWPIVAILILTTKHKTMHKSKPYSY